MQRLYSNVNYKVDNHFFTKSWQNRAKVESTKVNKAPNTNVVPTTRSKSK